MSEVWRNPDWENAGRVHDWRNHVSEHIKSIWKTFNDVQKEAIYEQAEDRAGQEHWWD